MESNEEDASNEMDMSGDQRQMDDEFKMRVLTLGKMEQRTAQAFYSKRIETEFKWPELNESKDDASLRKKLNSARLKKEQNKLIKRISRENESEEARRIRLEKDNMRNKKRYWERKREKEDERARRNMVENQCVRLEEEVSKSLFDIECERLMSIADKTDENIH